MLLAAGCAGRPALEQWPELHDPPLQAHVQDLVCRLVTGPCAAFPVLLVDRRETQAEVLPDGRVALRLGLLMAVKEEAELVFVLAHEIAHRQLGHRAPRDFRDRLPLELAADAVALEALGRLGYPEDAGHRLIARLTPAMLQAPEQEHMAQAQIEARLAALPRGSDRQPAADARLQMLLRAHR
jgi:predicted Zn-dependent protease